MDVLPDTVERKRQTKQEEKKIMDEATKRSIEAIHEMLKDMEIRLTYLESMNDPFGNTSSSPRET